MSVAFTNSEFGTPPTRSRSAGKDKEVSNKKLEEFWLKWHGRTFTKETWGQLMEIIKETSNEMEELLRAVAKNWHIPWVRLRESGLLRLLEAGQALSEHVDALSYADMNESHNCSGCASAVKKWDAALIEMRGKIR